MRGVAAGQGSFGKVYMGVWNHTRVAIKVLMDGSGLIMGQEAQEEQALATISSPLLAKLVDVGACCAVLCCQGCNKE